jgi:hypothetical protein
MLKLISSADSDSDTDTDSIDTGIDTSGIVDQPPCFHKNFHIPCVTHEIAEPVG